MTSRSSFSGILLCLFATAAFAAATATEDYAHAARLVGQRNADEAIPILESVISRAPGFYPAYKMLANAYLRKHAPEQAEAYFATLLGDPERSAFAHYALGQINHENSNDSVALEHYAACIQQLPNSVPCYAPLTASLLKATGLSATVNDLASHIALNRDGPYACLAFTEFLLVQRKIREGLHAAQNCLTQAEALGQIDFLAAAHDLVARAYAGTGAAHDGRLDHHLEAARFAALLDDPEAAFHHNMDVCIDYALLDRYAEAQECLERRLTDARTQQNRSWLELGLETAAQTHRARGELDQELAQWSDILVS